MMLRGLSGALNSDHSPGSVGGGKGLLGTAEVLKERKREPMKTNMQ